MPIITEPPKSQSIFHHHSALKDTSKDYHNWSTPSRTVYPHHRDYTTGTHQSTLEVGGARSSMFIDSYPPESHTVSPGFTQVTRESYDGSFYRASKIDSPEVPITHYGRTNSTDQEHRITRDYPLNPTQRTPSTDKVIPTRQSSNVKGQRHDDDSSRHHRRSHRAMILVNTSREDAVMHVTAVLRQTQRIVHHHEVPEGIVDVKSSRNFY